MCAEQVEVRIQNAEQLMEAGVIEPSGDLYQRKNFITARAITNTKRGIQVVKMINCGDKEVQLNEGTT